MTVEPQAAVTDILRISNRRPALFFEKVLGSHLRRWQYALCADVSRQLLAGERHIRVHVRTCHGAGKTFWAAGMAIWFMSTRPESRGLTTAPTWAGVKNLLWPEIAKLYHGSLLPGLGFGRLLDIKLEQNPGWYLIGGASDRPENLEGHHSSVAAIRIIDEAKAVDEGVFVSTAGMLDAPETFDLWISTPSIPVGSFHDRDVKGMRDEAGNERLIRRVVTIDDLIAEGIPGKPEAKAEALERWGEDSPEYQSRMLARYIADVEGALYPFGWVERAISADWKVSGPPVAGFDVAGSKDGDESVVALAHGPDAEGRYDIVSVVGWHERDTMLSKGRALSVAGQALLRVDVIGIGKGVHDAIAETHRSTEEYRASDAASESDRFVNRKAEDAWHLRTLLERKQIRLPNDDLLRKQLLAMRFQITSAGKIKVVDPKDSPDRVDAILIALGSGPPHETQVEVVRGWTAPRRRMF